MTRKLSVLLHSVKAGLLEQDDSGNLTFTYDHVYLASESARAISVSMSLIGTAYTNAVAKPCFSGLLPDESARTRLAAAMGISDSNAFGMLEIIGGDCAVTRCWVVAKTYDYRKRERRTRSRSN